MVLFDVTVAEFLKQVSDLLRAVEHLFRARGVDVPGEKVELGSFALNHLFKEGARPGEIVCKCGTAELDLGEATAQIEERGLEEVEELLGRAAPASLFVVVDYVCVKVSLVPDLPILDGIVEAVCPALGVVQDDVLADLCPLERVCGLYSSVFAGPMLDGGAETVIDLAVSLKAGGNVFIGVDEIVSGGIVGIAREIGEDAMNVHYVL